MTISKNKSNISFLLGINNTINNGRQNKKTGKLFILFGLKLPLLSLIIS